MPEPQFHSRTVAKETEHTLSLIEPHLRDVGSVLDVGCGAGYVAWRLADRFAGEVQAVDVGDFRKVPTPGFSLYDGLRLPFADGRFDVLLFAFVLHHVPDVHKPLLLAEARRVARRRLIVLEDTPRSGFDRIASWCHGTRFRRRVRSQERFGFLSTGEWTRLFDLLQMRTTRVQPLSRWCRSVWQPFARSLFVLDL
jgi:ubiquinone/menaquinone biosynthesis C-methylase UbiE